MRDLPTGTVTFLFTDVEGSTRLWEHHPEQMRQALVRHDAIIEGEVERHEGVVVRPRGEGDSRFAVFARATGAVAAAAAIQVALQGEVWPTETSLRIRMALHTGEADLRDGDYYGSAVNRCARLRAIAHGGQTLVSQTTYDLVQHTLPPGSDLQELGEHRLADLVHAEHVFQLLAPNLPADFPPLRSLATVPNNLPLQLTSFVGREREMADVKRELAATRLLTLTGVGGCGKTRLALQISADLLPHYPDGVWLVELAPLADPDLVANTVATAVGVREQPGRPVLETLLHTLRARRLLLVLDNCEHLLDACARFTAVLLRGCPKVHILATSREALSIAGEISRRVPSLALPPSDQLPSLENLRQGEAVQLFLERARAVSPEFALTSRNAPSLAQVCHRLDGIPLAIELAAARVKVLTVEQLAHRLDDRFRLLTGGSRTALPRQQTLRATIDWSYHLLNTREQTLFTRLSVFAGGWTLEAAEAIGAGELIEREDVLDLLAHLVDKSLVVAEASSDGAARYRLLETLRQYGHERLLETGDAAAVRDRHRDWYRALAERAVPALRGPEQLAWLARLDAEHANLRAALAWCLDTDAEAGVQLAGHLWLFWRVRSHYAEGRRWLDSLLARTSERSVHRVQALLGAGRLAADQGDWTTSRTLFGEALALSRELGATRITAETLRELGTVSWFHGDLAQARVIGEEALALSRAVGDQHAVGACVYMLGIVLAWGGDYARGRALVGEGLALSRAAGDRWTITVALWASGSVALDEGNLEQAEALCAEGLALAQELGSPRMIAWHQGCLGRAAFLRGDLLRATALLQHNLDLYTDQGNTWGMGVTLHSLGLVAWRQGDDARATALLRESLVLRREMGNRPGIAECLEGLAAVAIRHDQPARAARLLGAADAIRRTTGAPLPPVERPNHAASMQVVRVALGREPFASAWEEGQTLPLEQAIAEALAVVASPSM